jgi:hypothetical protein
VDLSAETKEAREGLLIPSARTDLLAVIREARVAVLDPLAKMDLEECLRELCLILYLGVYRADREDVKWVGTYMWAVAEVMAEMDASDGLEALYPHHLAAQGIFGLAFARVLRSENRKTIKKS